MSKLVNSIVSEETNIQMQESISKRYTFFFDLDGVLVDNVEFEIETTLRISGLLAEHHDISLEKANALWSNTLRKEKDKPHWHDYAHHCRILGIPDAWRQAHIENADLLRAVNGAHEALNAASSRGDLWLVSDATEWVVEFKLQSVGFDKRLFEKVYCLDRCGCSKRFPGYWRELANSLSHPCVYIDNRVDLLDFASSQLDIDHLFWVQFDDHPLSLDLWSQRRPNMSAKIVSIPPGDLAPCLLGLP